MYKAVIYNNEVDLRANRGITLEDSSSFISPIIRLARKESIKHKGSYGLVRDDSGRCYYMYEESSDLECYYVPKNNVYTTTYSRLAEVSKIVNIEDGSLLIYNLSEGHTMFRLIKPDKTYDSIDVPERLVILDLIHKALTGIPKNVDSIILPAKLHLSGGNMECFYSCRRGSNNCYLAFVPDFEVPWVNLKG